MELNSEGFLSSILLYSGIGFVEQNFEILYQKAVVSKTHGIVRLAEQRRVKTVDSWELAMVVWNGEVWRKTITWMGVGGVNSPMKLKTKCILPAVWPRLTLKAQTNNLQWIDTNATFF